jgi:hypothetical protein
VAVGTQNLVACCPMCALGVAARTQEDISARVEDALTGEPIRVSTFRGSLASLDPSTAVAWYGQRPGPGGQMVSAGCFRQAWFTSQEHLARWLEDRPEITGREITIRDALLTRMQLTPEQIAGASKLDVCP